MAQRSSQAVSEAVVLPTSSRPRGSQAVSEAVVLPTSQKPRCSQVVLEVIFKAGSNAFPRGYW